MTALVSSDCRPAAAAAARRLGCSRPLYAVSLNKALSQLLRLNAACPQNGQLQPSCGSHVRQRVPTDCGVGSDITQREGASVSASSLAPQALASLTVELDEATTAGRWLTGKFVAQVRAHFEAALLECASPHDDTRGTGSAYDSVECDARQRYLETFSQAALQWGLLLLLAAEPSLFSEVTNHNAGGRHESPDQHSERAPYSLGAPASTLEQTVSEHEVADGSEDNTESADAAVRGERPVGRADVRLFVQLVTPKRIAVRCY